MSLTNIFALMGVSIGAAMVIIGGIQFLENLCFAVPRPTQALLSFIAFVVGLAMFGGCLAWVK
jgi:uncharacterized integral membrane protein